MDVKLYDKWQIDKSPALSMHLFVTLTDCQLMVDEKDKQIAELETAIYEINGALLDAETVQADYYLLQVGHDEDSDLVKLVKKHKQGE